MANPFDDLVPPPKGGGLFDDLIPGAQGGAGSPAPPKPGPFVPRDMPIGEGIGHAAGQFTRRFNESLGDTLAAAAKLGHAISPLGPISRVSEHFGGPTADQLVDKAHGVYDQFFDTKAPPETSGGYIAGAAGKMIADTLPYTLALLSGGASLPAAGVTGVRAVPGVTTSVIDGVATRTVPMATPYVAPSAAASVLPAGVTGTAAPTGGMFSRIAQRELGNLAATPQAIPMALKSTVQSAAAIPGATAIGDFVGATGAGIGGAVADLASGKDRAEPLSRTASEVAGAAVPLAWQVASPTMWIGRAAKEGYSLARGRPTDLTESVGGWFGRKSDALKAKAREQVLGEVEGRIAADPTAQANVEKAKEVSAAIPDFKPTLAQRTDVPSVKVMQRDLEARTGGENLNAMADIHKGNVDAIKGFTTSAAPEAPKGGTPADVMNHALEQRIAALEAKLGQQAEKPATQVAATQAGMPTTAPTGPADRTFDPKRAGETLRDQALTERGRMDAEVTRMRGAIDPGGAVKVNPDDIRAGIDADKVKSAFGTDATDPIVARMLRAAPEPQAGVVGADGLPMPAKASEPASLQETMDFASKLNTVQRRLAGQQMRTPQQDEQLTSVRTALDHTMASIDKAVAATGDPAMAERLKDFRAFYRDEYVPRFQQGTVAEMRARDAAGKPKVNAEDIPGKFFAPNSLTEAEQFQKVFAGNKQAQDTMPDHALASLRDSLGGKPLTQAAIDAWKAKHSRVLDRVPEVRAAVDRIDVSAAESRLASIDARRRTVVESTLAQQIGREPEKTVAAAVADPALMRQLARTAREGGPDSERALKKLVWDHVLGKDALPDPAKLGATLDENARSLSIALSPKHLSDLRTIMEASRIQRRMPAPQGSGENSSEAFTEKFKEATGSSLPSLMQRFISVERGRSGAAYEAATAGAQYVKNLSDKQYNALLKEVLYDGRLAADLSAFIRTDQKPPRERARGYLLAIGADSLDRGGEKRESK